MNNLVKLALGIALVFSFLSCKKNQLGGKSSLKGVVHHHGKAIANAIVYIKFNATEFPGDDYKLYDTSVQADAEGNYAISFYKGSYYVYAKGNDLDVSYPHLVKGGISISIRNNEKLVKNIAITE
jgi:hypothetical protein